MSKEAPPAAKIRPEKKITATSTPALLAALALLSTSLGVTTGAPADPNAVPSAGENVGGVKLARKAGKGQQEYLATQSKQQLQSNQHKSPMQSNQIKGSNQIKMQSNQIKSSNTRSSK